MIIITTPRRRSTELMRRLRSLLLSDGISQILPQSNSQCP
jgi:hypothetical protein